MFGKPRPIAIYREEHKNKHGNWVCSRMTYDKEMFAAWRNHYASYVRKYGKDNIIGDRRFVIGDVVWGNPDSP